MPSASALFVVSAMLAACAGGATTAPPAAVSASSVPTIKGGAAIWIHPLPDCSLRAGNGGSCSVDSLALFDGTSSWPTVAKRASVFGIYSSYPLGLSDSRLGQMIAFVNARGISIEIEAPALQATATCGTNVEGFVPTTLALQAYTLTYLRRLKAGGANVRYVKMDEPFYFGSVSNVTNACHFPLTTVARDVVQFVQLVHSVYPNALVGDVEPVLLQGNGDYTPGPVSAITHWWDAYQAVSGAAFPFYIADMDFSNPTWMTLANELAAAAHERNMKFGIIYTGDYQGSSDSIWTRQVIARFEQFQGVNAATPDFALFQSWEPHPVHTLPETDQSTFTGAVKAYIDAGG